MKNTRHQWDAYFRYRNVTPSLYEEDEVIQIPGYLSKVLAEFNVGSPILDVGCGFGHLIHALQNEGYKNVCGIDISSEAVSYCRTKGLNVSAIAEIDSYAEGKPSAYDLIMMSHVLEHIEKNRIIETLIAIKGMLRPGGRLVVMVPNAQSNTGCYWAYEDFTHTTLFTAGSLIYVLRAAGYSEIKFLDLDGLEGVTGFKRVIKKVLLWAYIANKNFWNKVTSSSYHRPSPAIFTYEIKCVASK